MTMLYSWQNLLKRIDGIENPVGVEVGVHRGEWSRRVLENRKDATLYMVDAWSPETYEFTARDAVTPEKRADYEQNWLDNYVAALKVALIHAPRAIPIRGRSADVARSLQGRVKFDFAYLDAAHDFDSLVVDITHWRPLVNKGGWLCGHDYGNPDFPGVKQAVDACFGDAVEVDSDFTWWVRV